VAVDRDGHIHVADGNNHRVVKYAAVPTTVTRSSWGRIQASYR